MTSVLTYQELKPGQQVGIQTTDRGVLSAVAADANGLVGVTLGVIQVGAGNQTFNGDGSGGANKLSDITTLVISGITTARNWNFQPNGVRTGALVFCCIDGFNLGEVVFQNGGVAIVVNPLVGNVDVTNTNPNPPFNPNAPIYPILFFDGANWKPVHTTIVST